jgi:hypothetical protein
MPPKVLECLGEYIRHPPMKAYCDISAQTFDEFHRVMGGHEKADEGDRDYLMTRLMYISEATSTAVRLNASWALTHPAMSLTRDRYEQVVRFTYLARQKNDTEMKKFFAYYHSRANKIFKTLHEAAKDEFAKLVDDPPEWALRNFTREEREQFDGWGQLDLKSMVVKRDNLPGFGSMEIARQKLGLYYAPVYAQFSSVSHSDMYSVALLGLHKSPETDLLALAPDPHWPATLASFNALFDIIQCYECAAGVYDRECEPQFQSLFARWHQITKRTFGTV